MVVVDSVLKKNHTGHLYRPTSYSVYEPGPFGHQKLIRCSSDVDQMCSDIRLSDFT